MKRKFAIAVILLLSHFIFYVLGSVINRQIMLSSFAKEFKQADAEATLGRYDEYKYIALNVSEGKYDKVKCAAELGASAMFDDLKSCVADQDCRIVIEQRLHEAAPEVLGEAPVKFSYVKSKDGIKSCADK